MCPKGWIKAKGRIQPLGYSLETTGLGDFRMAIKVSNPLILPAQDRFLWLLLPCGGLFLMSSCP